MENIDSDLAAVVPMIMKEKRKQDPELDEYLKRLKPAELFNKFLNPSFQTYFVEKNYVFPEIFVPNYLKFHKMEIRESDVFITSVPKTGTTWTQEILYLLCHNLDYEKAASGNMEERFPFVEFFDTDVESLENIPNPRLIKSHLPLALMPKSIFDKKSKVVYVARNPKDALVSMYYFFKKMNVSQYSGTISDLVDTFVNDQVSYCPFDQHVLEAWNRRNEENILFLLYEDLKKDLPQEIRKIAKFLGKECSEDDIQKLANHCSFSSMSKNEATNYIQWEKKGFVKKDDFTFMRKGTIGDWKNHFDDESNRKIDKWIEERFGKSDLRFTYE